MRSLYKLLKSSLYCGSRSDRRFSLHLPSRSQPQQKIRTESMADSAFYFLSSFLQSRQTRFNFLQPLRQWIDSLEINNPKMARLIYWLIPGNCPFERDVKVFGRTVLHIPPLCKLNPLYEQLVGLRFRSLCYLVDTCGETP